VTTSEKLRAALVGAAAGDALGWPQELRGGRVGGRRNTAPGIAFQEWSRRAGGRFLSHEERVRPGEYSDDTQLLICTARSILQREAWLQQFVQNELPAWSVYQRGAGGATKRAAQAWASGTAPWSENFPEDDRKRYFQAGGNGVAMRIMPHVATASSQKSFADLKAAILLNGIATHGHPRALIGAVLYGYVAWVALRQCDTLPYGMLIDAALEDEREWATLPQIQLFPEEWKSSWSRSGNVGLDGLWDQTARETIDLLRKARRGIQAGALAIDEDVLRELGCFDPAVNGAGTISSAGAIYLASKYAPDPANGLIEAAFARGADTDTLASMTGAILGLISGMEWLSSTAGILEDSEYLQRLSSELLSTPVGPTRSARIDARDRSADLKQFMVNLQGAALEDRIWIPDGRVGTIKLIEPISTGSQSLSGSHWTVRTADGQTLHIKKLIRLSSGSQQQLGLKERGFPRLTSSVQAVKIPVAELPRARRFYKDVLGLAISRESKNLINFGNTLTLVPADYKTAFPYSNNRQSIICIVTNDLELCMRRVSEADIKITPIERRAGRKFFSCLDFDDNVVEVFENATRSERTVPKNSTAEVE
jgi:ADP-ribosylglycohydrolase/catechol 2,3-dioxygenase-like lactoylglutathione lyase family enzyme